MSDITHIMVFPTVGSSIVRSVIQTVTTKDLIDLPVEHLFQMGTSTSVNTQNDIAQFQASIDRELEQWKDKPVYKLYQILKPLSVQIEQIEGKPLYIETEPTDEAVFAELKSLFGEENVVIDTYERYVSIKITYEGNLLSELCWLAIASRPVKETISELFNPETYQGRDNIRLSKGSIHY